MAKSNKPIFWGPFAAGGTVTAFIIPVIIILTLMAALGAVPDGLQYQQMHDFAAGWLGKLILLGIIVLSLWHGAHRLRVTLHDFGLRMDGQVAVLFYGIAGFGTIGSLVWLIRI